MRRFCLLSLASFALCFSVRADAAKVRLDFDASVPQITFAAEKIAQAVTDKRHQVVENDAEYVIRMRIQPLGKPPESFSIQCKGSDQIIIAGQDAAGAMYGGLEVAELIQIGGLDTIQDLEQSPYTAMRGTKFNIPLDVRTPSYTDPCDAAQQNIAEMWSFDFWKNYIDSLASHRYNFISLWNLHPFPSLVKVPDYPDVALDDVQRSTVEWEEYYSGTGTGFDAPEIINNVEVLKRMTIAEKIAFWQKVMRYGKERNVDFYFVTWNTFVYGTGGKYGITDSVSNETTIDYFRWGAPDFVREFIQNIPYDVSRGFYYGSDQYIWGREFLSLDPKTPRQIEVDKHWYHWMLWGRLGYNPQLNNDRFVQILQARFPRINAKQLFAAWQSASMIYPLTTGFHWGSLDFQWYIEACKSRSGPAQTESGFHDVNRFISLPPHPSTNNVSIPDYVKVQLGGEKADGVTPPEISQRIHENADRALAILETLEGGDSQELRKTLTDIRCMAYLGKHYGHKIRGATELALYRESSEKGYRDRAIEELTSAAEYWSHYMDTATKQYKNPLWTNRVGFVDWKELYQQVLHDIDIARAVAHR